MTDESPASSSLSQPCGLPDVFAFLIASLRPVIASSVSGSLPASEGVRDIVPFENVSSGE